MMKVGTLIEVDYWGNFSAGGLSNIQSSLVPDFRKQYYIYGQCLYVMS